MRMERGDTQYVVHRIYGLAFIPIMIPNCGRLSVICTLSLQVMLDKVSRSQVLLVSRSNS